MATSPPLMEQRSPALRDKPSPKAQAAPAPTLPAPYVVPALVSGALLWLCYHPLSWGWLAWVALVPLLCLVRSTARPRNIYIGAWVGGTLFFGAALRWMGAADQMPFPKWWMHYAGAMLALYCALYFPAAIYLTRVLERRTRLPLVVTFPVVWIALEYFRSFFITGFAWYLLAHTQHNVLPLIQVSDLGGTVTLSILIAAVNAIGFDILYQFAAVRTFLRLTEPPAGRRTFGNDWPDLGDFFLAAWRRGIVLETALVATLIGGAYVYGSWRLQQPPALPGPRVALLQGSLDQRLRDAAFNLPADRKEAAKVLHEERLKVVRQIGAHYEALCRLAHRCDPAPALFIWPETSYPGGWIEASREVPIDQVPELWRQREAEDRDGLHLAFKSLQTPQLLGVNTQFLNRQKKETRYNSALLLNADANPDGRYDKMHRVPFGEFVPFRDWLPFMDLVSPYDFDYSIRAGESFTRFKLDKYHFGVLICYEDTDPYLAPHYVRDEPDGPPVDFLVNISNDGWFDGSSEHEEHLAVSRFRSVECRRAMVRSVNMGVSAVIDGNGRVLKAATAHQEGDLAIWSVQGVGGHVPSLPHSEWSAFKKVAGVLVAHVPIDQRFSLYALVGDWLGGLCWAVIGVATVGTWLYRRVRPAAAA